MPGVSRRADDEHRPFGKSKQTINGVRKVKEMVYEGWKITLLHRDQGVQVQRIAYSARVAEIGSKISFYIPSADSQKLVIKNAKKLVDRRIERSQPEKSKFYTIEKVLHLWFRDDENPPPAGSSSPSSETSSPTASSSKMPSSTRSLPTMSLPTMSLPNVANVPLPE